VIRLAGATLLTPDRRIDDGVLTMERGRIVFAGPAAQAPPAAAPAPPHNTMRPAIKWKRFDYTCENNVKITVYLNGNTVKVRLFRARGRLVEMYRKRMQKRPSAGRAQAAKE